VALFRRRGELSFLARVFRAALNPTTVDPKNAVNSFPEFPERYDQLVMGQFG
jgi:hypothetical protein